MQTLNSISTEKNQTIVFPLPIDIVSTMMATKEGEEEVEDEPSEVTDQVSTPLVEAAPPGRPGVLAGV